MTLEEAIKTINDNKDKICFWGPDGKIYSFDQIIYLKQDNGVIFKFKNIVAKEKV